jgi:hypothetical protein
MHAVKDVSGNMFEVNLYWSTVRGPWISIKGPAGFRIGHKL